jgi:hypothetical protein
MHLALVNSPEFQITLDPAQVEDRVPSVAFNVLADLHMPFQAASVRIKECCFTHAALNEFEQQLSALRTQARGSATLSNMSGLSILTVVRDGNRITTSINASDTVQMASTTIEVNGSASEIARMYGNIRSFAKWW